MKAIFSLFTFLFLFSFLGISQWEFTNGPIGANFRSLKKNENFIYASTNGGLFKTSDGQNWIKADDQLPEGTSFGSLQINKDTLTAIANFQHDIENKYIFSFDGGKSWSIFSRYNPVEHGQLSYFNGAFYSTRKKAYTRDFGISWTSVTTSGTGRLDLSGIYFFGNNIFASGYESMYLLTGDFNNWIFEPLPIPKPLSLDFSKDSIIIGTDRTSDTIRYSLDYGQTWTASKDVFEHDKNLFTAVDNYIFTAKDDLYRSSDFGKTWENLGNIPQSGYQFTDLSSIGNTLVAETSYSNPYISTDLGETWQLSYNGIWAYGGGYLDEYNNKLIHSGTTASGVQVFDPKSKEWEYVLTPQLKDDNATVFKDKIFLSGDLDPCRVSSDFGATWETFYPGEITDFIGYFINHNDDVLFAQELLGFRKHVSFDDGQTWKLFRNFPEIIIAQDNWLVSSGNRIFTVHEGNLLWSEDVGITWEAAQINNLPIGSSIRAFAFDKGKGVLKFTNPSLPFDPSFISSDNGKTWSRATSDVPISFFTQGGNVSKRQLLQTSGDKFFIADFINGVNFSPDGGNNWVDFNDGLPSREIVDILLLDSTLYVTVSGSGTWKRPLENFDFNAANGFVFEDGNLNDQKDNLEENSNHVLFNINNNEFFTPFVDGNFEVIYDTNPNGNDTLFCRPNSKYTTVNPPFYILKNPSEDSIQFALNTQYGIEDISVNIVNRLFRPGFNTTIYFQIKNSGTKVTSTEAFYVLDSKLEIQDIYPSPAQSVGDTLFWEIKDLNPEEKVVIAISGKTKTNVTIGSQVTMFGAAIPSLEDANPRDNYSSQKIEVVGSYDPNDKKAFPSEIVSPEQIEAGEKIEYTIRFQNTGNYPADFVRIEDLLSDNLDLNTFEVLSFSHPMTFKIKKDRTVEFFFEDIFLPDSLSDERNSHGFVLFAIAPKMNLELGKTIENTASIYFDYNSPIITNTVQNEVWKEISLVLSPKNVDKIKIYPNPNRGIFFLEKSNGERLLGKLKIFDVTGKLLFEQNISETESEISIPGFSQGSYFLQITEAENKVITGKMIVE